MLSQGLNPQPKSTHEPTTSADFIKNPIIPGMLTGAGIGFAVGFVVGGPLGALAGLVMGVGIGIIIGLAAAHLPCKEDKQLNAEQLVKLSKELVKKELENKDKQLDV